jgi:hypothetical protein
VFQSLPKYHTKILLRVFNTKLREENIFKLTFANESLHQDSKDNGAIIVNFTTSENLVVKSAIFPHKYTCTFFMFC